MYLHEARTAAQLKHPGLVAVYDVQQDGAACTSYRSMWTARISQAGRPRAQGFGRELAAARIREFQALRHLTVGDFYPLLPYTLDADQWIGYQFHRDDLDEGLVLVFRREKSAYAAVDVAIRGLQPEQVYELTFADASPQRRATVRNLRAGCESPLTAARLSPDPLQAHNLEGH